jgi:hypothetical protein
MGLISGGSKVCDVGVQDLSVRSHNRAKAEIMPRHLYLRTGEVKDRGKPTVMLGWSVPADTFGDHWVDLE